MKPVKAVISLSKGTRLEVPIMLAAFGPMRRGEICALTLDDIDTENNIIHVSKAVAEDKDKNLIIKTPKTYSSDRYITYPKQVIELIMSQGYVVEMNPRSLSEAFRYFLEKNHIPHFRFHDLRHYCASSLHAIGIPDAYIMRRGGWKTDTVLKEVYRHTLTDQITPMDEKAVNQFDKLL
jgi:integrase